jgi:hypothetical protein
MKGCNKKCQFAIVPRLLIYVGTEFGDKAGNKQSSGGTDILPEDPMPLFSSGNLALVAVVLLQVLQLL